MWSVKKDDFWFGGLGHELLRNTLPGDKARQSSLSVSGRALIRSAAEDVHPSPPTNTIAPWGRIRLLTMGIAEILKREPRQS